MFTSSHALTGSRIKGAGPHTGLPLTGEMLLHRSANVGFRICFVEFVARFPHGCLKCLKSNKGLKPNPITEVLIK